MLNEGQCQVYDYIVNGFINADHHQLNIVMMGTAGAGKSFLIRALEHGLWQAVQRKYGEERYPTIRSIIKLAASNY
jgi:predicted GTPase